MATSTKNEILDQVESVIDVLSTPNGAAAIDVLLANRQALIQLHVLANELQLGAYERAKQARRKARQDVAAPAGQVPLELGL